MYLATFHKDANDLVSPAHTQLTAAELQAKKRDHFPNAECFEITQAQHEQLNDGWIASEAGGVVTVTEPVGWLENKTNEAWRKIRKERNQLLKDSDYIMVSDAPITTEKKEEWETYRQALRDIPRIMIVQMKSCIPPSQNKKCHQ